MSSIQCQVLHQRNFKNDIASIYDFQFMNFRNDIQGLRGIAVLLVLFYHLYPKRITGGFIGVDIFFVISGFLVCYSIENRIKNNKNEFYVKFYAARIRRLLPASLLTIWFVTYYIFRFDITYFSIYKQDAIAGLLIYANYNYYFNKVDYFHAGLKESPLLHYWSLSLEEQFYIISPILTYVFFNHVKILYIVLSIISLIICINYGYNDRNKGYFFLSSRSWEFLLGTLTRYIPLKVEYVLQCSTYISTILLFIISIHFNDKMLYPSYNTLIPVLLSIYVLYSSQTNILISNKCICIIGNLSYSIYLIHFPLRSIYNPSFLHYILALLLCSTICYYFIESPFYKGSFILSDKITYIMSFIFVTLTYIYTIKLHIETDNILGKIKHYTTAELIGDFVHNQKSCCTLSYTTNIYKSSILFIGDSHIQQHIIALFRSEYKYNYQLLLIAINSNSYNKKYVDKYFNTFIPKYHFKLCFIGNLITSDTIYSQIEKMAERIIPMCDKILLSNDNPRHSVDPNSCIKKNKDDCYGEINKTCFVPKKFSKPNNSIIDVITLWDENIINGKKCLYYYNKLPIYSDNNHLSLFYLKIIVKNLFIVISKYVDYDRNYKYNSKCHYYYYLPSTDYVNNCIYS